MSLRGHRVGIRSVTQSAQYLVVGYGSATLALPADLVRGILTPPETGAQSALTIMGETYHAEDVRARLEIPAAPDGISEARTVLCSHGVRHRAFQVDRVLELTDVERTQILPLPPHFRSAEREWFAGLFLYLDGIALIVNPDWLLNERESPLSTSAMADRYAVGAREAAADTHPEQSRPAVLVAPWLPMELEEANDAEDTPWAPI